MRKSKQLPAEAQLLKNLPEPKPLYFRRQDSLKLFGVTPRVLEDLAMKKQGPNYWKQGKYCFYHVGLFEEWLTQNPVKTTSCV
jgi:hypothetical protein